MGLPRDRRQFLSALFLMMFFQSAALAVVPPLLVHLSDSFGLSPTQAGAVIGVLGFSRLFTSLPLGLYLSRISRASQVVWVGVGLSLVGTVLSGMAWGYPWLLAGRALVGIALGMSYLGGVVLILSLSPRSHMARIINIWEAAAIAGHVIHTLAAGVIADRWGWRLAFLWAAASVVFSGAMLALGTQSLKRAMLGQALVEHQPDRSAPVLVPAGRGSVYALIVSTAFTLVVCWTGVLTTLVPLYGGNHLGLNSSQIGAVLAVAYVLYIVLLLPAGRVMDRYSRIILLVPTLSILAVGVLLLPYTRSFWTYLVLSAFFATGFVVWNVPSTLVADLCLGRRQGFALGLVRFIGDFAAFLSPVALGYLVERVGYGAATWSVAFLLAGNLFFAVFDLTRQRRAGTLLDA